jgi:hypothetical protein
MRKEPNKKKLARERALAGKADEAVAMLAPAAATDATAAASLIQLLAFKGQWNDVAKVALPFVDKLDLFDTLNVYSDTVALVAWAGVNGAPVRPAELKARVKKSSPPPVRIALQRAVKLLSDPKGNGRVFLSDADPDPQGSLEAIEVMRKDEPKLWTPGRAAELTDRLLLIARSYGDHKGALALIKGDASELNWDQTVFAAEALVRKKDLKGAWNFIEARLATWWPLDVAEVAPVILLLNPDLKRLMTSERCRTVLSTPRGPDA